MNSEHIKNKDPLQLQQIIIFLKAELAKYKDEVIKYKESDHYSLIEEVEQENLQLTNEKNELEKRISDYEERIQLHEVQREKDMTTIENLRKTKADLPPITKKLTEVIKKLKEVVNTNEVYAESRKVNEYLVKEIEGKNNLIGKLQHEIAGLQESTGTLMAVGKSQIAIDSKILMQLDDQMKKVLVQSLDYEKELDAKLLIIDALEHKLDQVSVEIDNVKIFGVEGRILKEY